MVNGSAHRGQSNVNPMKATYIKPQKCSCLDDASRHIAIARWTLQFWGKSHPSKKTCIRERYWKNWIKHIMLHPLECQQTILSESLPCGGACGRGASVEVSVPGSISFGDIGLLRGCGLEKKLWLLGSGCLLLRDHSVLTNPELCPRNDAAGMHGTIFLYLQILSHFDPNWAQHKRNDSGAWNFLIVLQSKRSIQFFWGEKTQTNCNRLGLKLEQPEFENPSNYPFRGGKKMKIYIKNAQRQILSGDARWNCLGAAHKQGAGHNIFILRRVTLGRQRHEAVGFHQWHPFEVNAAGECRDTKWVGFPIPTCGPLTNHKLLPPNFPPRPYDQCWILASIIS